MRTLGQQRLKVPPRILAEIMSEAKLRHWHMLSLKQRVLQIKREYDFNMSVASLNRLYKEHKIRFAAPQYVNSGAYFKRGL